MNEQLAEVPDAEHDIAFHAFGALWRRRQRALGDAVGPVGIHLQSALTAEGRHIVAHDGAVRDGLLLVAAIIVIGVALFLYALVPGFDGVADVGDFARGLVAELVTELAAFLHVPDPFLLGLESRRDTVASRTGAREFFFVRHFDQREPIVGGIVLRGILGAGCCHGGVIDGLAGRGIDGLGVHQAVTTRPHLICALRKIGEHVAALLVGDHDLDEAVGLQRFRDHPHARFRTFRARDDTADIVGVHFHGLRRGRQRQQTR